MSGIIALSNGYYDMIYLGRSSEFPDEPSFVAAVRREYDEDEPAAGIELGWWRFVPTQPPDDSMRLVRVHPESRGAFSAFYWYVTT